MVQQKKKIPGEGLVHYETARKKRERPKPKMQPPMAPMIDVTFQLLLFFLLATTFRQAEGNLPGTLPDQGGIAAAGQEFPLRPIRIVITPTGVANDGAVWQIGSSAIATAKELYDNLAAQQSTLGTKDVPVVIQPRSDVRWQYVIEAFNQSVRCKFKNIGFAAAS